MSFFKIWKSWFCFAWLPMFFGGDSSSETKNETNNIDQRLLLENGGAAGSASTGGTVVINSLDGGAISKSFGLGEHALDKVTTIATASQSASARTSELALQGAFHSIDGSKAAFESALGEVSKAYEDSKIGNRSTLNTVALLVGGAVVVVALVFVTKKGKA